MQSEKLQIEELLGTIQEKLTSLEENHAEAISENSSLRQSVITSEDHLKLAAERLQKIKFEYDEVIGIFYLFLPFALLIQLSYL